LRTKGFFASAEDARKILAKRRDEKRAVEGVDRNKWYLLT